STRTRRARSSTTGSIGRPSTRCAPSLTGRGRSSRAAPTSTSPTFSRRSSSCWRSHDRHAPDRPRPGAGRWCGRASARRHRALAEPTIILAVFALALRAETINLGDVVERLAREPLLAANPAHLLAFVAFFIVMLAETGRLPVDNPATHLELTMIHEAMVLEYSGRYLALVGWASAMRLFVFMTLLANLFVPWGVTSLAEPVPVLLGLLALAGKLAVLAAALA